MALPVGWPPRPASGVRSIRYYQKVAAVTAAFADNAYLFADNPDASMFVPLPYVAPGSTAPVATGGVVVTSMSGGGQNKNDVAPVSHQNPPATQQESPHPMIWAMGIRVVNLGASGDDMEISFDGTNVHGYVPGGTAVVYMRRHEAGIAVRGIAAKTPPCAIEAW